MFIHPLPAQSRPVGRVSGRVRGQAGQALVEFALVVPMLLVILSGIIDFSWAFHDYITTTNAVREGARVGVTGASLTIIQSKVADKSSGLLTTDMVDVDTCVSGCTLTGASGTDMTVSANYQYKFITPIAILIHLGSGSSSINLKASTTMRIE